MAIYRLGRNAVYDLANRYIESGGAEGIPCHRYGKQLRFPIAAIERDIGAPIELPIPDQPTPDESVDDRSSGTSSDGSQAALPFAS